MSGFPIVFHLQGRLCLVVGGGPVGIRKARALHQAGARVRLIDPAVNRQELPGIEVINRAYRQGDLSGASLAFAAAGDRQVNTAVAADARAAGIPVNVADAPEAGDFSLPALLQRGALTVAVSTTGNSPALAALVRDRLSRVLGPEWATVVEIAAALRQKKLTRQPEVEYNSWILHQLLEGDLPSLIAGGSAARIDRLLETLAGKDCSLAALGVRLPKEET